MKKILIIIAATTVVGIACKKSVAGQKSQWDNALKELDEASTQYPNLKKLLQQKATEAKAIMAEAEKIGNEEQKAEKMAAALAKLNENLGVVTEIKYKLKSLNDSISKIKQTKPTKDRVRRAEAELSEIYKEQSKIEEDFSALKPEDSDELNKQAREIVGRIISVTGRADRTLKMMKGK